MKRFLSVLFVAAMGLFASSCSIDDDYDLNKDIDKTFELKNFTFKLNETYTFNIKEILLEEYPLSALELLVIGSFTDIKVTLKNGLLGDFKVDGIAKDLTDDYLFKHGIVSATIINNLPEPISATVVALDSKGKVIPEITAILSTESIPTGTSTLSIDVKGNGGNINFDGVRFKLNMGTETRKVKFSSNQTITIKDFVISFPDGISKKGK